MIEEATIVLTGAKLLSSIWYSDGSGTSYPGVGIDGVDDDWEIVRIEKVGDGLIEIRIRRIKRLGMEEETPKTFDPKKVEFQGVGDQLPFQLPVEGYTYNDGQRFGSQISIRGSLVDAEMSKRIGMNARLTWVGRPWVVSQLPHYDQLNDLITLTIHVLD